MTITLQVATKDGSYTLYNPQYQELYNCHGGAMTCSRAIYLQNSGVWDRFQDQMPTSILEVGFGTGLNFLLTADAAFQSNCTLHYTALEKQLLEVDILRSLAHERYLAHPELHTRLWESLEEPKNRDNSFRVGGGVWLQLRGGDATQMAIPEETYDAVYLDAFSPENNPDLWQRSFIERLHQSLKRGGRLATYSVKGSIRRMMQDIGFEVEKRRSVPGKREVLVATRKL